MLRLVASPPPPEEQPLAPTAADGDRAAAARVVETATGVRIDTSVSWPADTLVALGLPHEIATELALTLADDVPPDVAPAVPLPSPAIPGLSPLGDDPPVVDAPVPLGWRRRVRAGRGRKQPGPAS